MPKGGFEPPRPYGHCALNPFHALPFFGLCGSVAGECSKSAKFSKISDPDDRLTMRRVMNSGGFIAPPFARRSM